MFLSYITRVLLSVPDLSRLATVLGGLPIVTLGPGSPVARAGIRYGDILMSINGVQTASWHDFFQARRGSVAPVTVRVFRHGVELDVELELPVQANSPREVLEAGGSWLACQHLS